MALSTPGPPASPKQLAYLAALLDKAGYASFREARHPLGLTQRQAGGKFTVHEASTLIDQLLDQEATPESVTADDAVRASQATTLRGIPADLLADELRRRGWTAREPS